MNCLIWAGHVRRRTGVRPIGKTGQGSTEKLVPLSHPHPPQSIPSALLLPDSLPMTKSLSRHPSQSPEDWDHPESIAVDPSASTATTSTTSRIAFPSQGGAAAAGPDAPTPDAQSHRGGRAGKRTLSELLKLHAEKGTDVHFSSEEANRLEELLGQWVRPFFFHVAFPFHDVMG
jgi:hypothetical protein